MILKTYTPLPRFPAISLSGNSCELHCKHCNATYLGHMLKGDTPESLLKICRKLKKKGAVGALLSGGSDFSGQMLNLDKLLPTISKIKDETNLILNIHPGLLSRDMTRKLHVDFASLEIPSNNVIRDIYGLHLTRAHYIEVYHNLKNAGIKVIPHVSVYNGDEHHLLEGIEVPETIVVIVFSPTRNTSMAKQASPTPHMVKGVVNNLKQMFPDTEISLGCMRTRERSLRYAIEIAALEGGATRIELPSKQTIMDCPSLGFSSYVNFDACCALPNELETRVLNLV
jgi:uncharacterized radical SAM superfamily protein